jgi:hypothetical protein
MSSFFNGQPRVPICEATSREHEANCMPHYAASSDILQGFSLKFLALRTLAGDYTFVQ